MKQKKNKILAAIKFVFGAAFGIIIGLLKTVFIDLFKNMHLYIIMATNKEEREKIRKETEIKRMVASINDRVKVVERLVYSIFNDPSYTKRDEGKTDLRDLEREAKK